MTASKLQGLKPQSLVAERDFLFGMKPKEEPTPKNKAPEKEKAVEVQTELLPVRVSYSFSGLLRRLTTKAATTSLSNYRGFLTVKFSILQDSHKCL